MSWENEAKRILKAELARRGVTYSALADALSRKRVAYMTPRAITNKLSRGTFTFVFFLQCMHAIDVQDLTIEVLAEPDNGTPLEEKAAGRGAPTHRKA